MTKFVRKTVAFALAALIFCGCESITPGVWMIESSGDPSNDKTASSGTLEIRDNGFGQLEVIRTVSTANTFSDDGRAIDLAWTGTVFSNATDSASLTFELRRADFIPSVDGLARTQDDAAPLVVTGALVESDGRTIAIEYDSDDPAFTFTETGTFVAPPGAEPHWKSERTLRQTFGEDLVFAALKPQLFDFFAEYHLQPDVAPFASDPRFGRAMHFQVVERTDFDYYRANPDRLRIANKVVDAISIEETKIRANAFRATYAAKAAHYHDIMENQGLIGAAGLTLESVLPGGEEEPDHDGCLWTGYYAFAQLLRWRETGEQAAVDEIRRVLGPILTLIDITGDPKTFARTLRPAGGPVAEPWRRGTGEWEHLDWKSGGNNDMSKGLVLAMAAGWEALPESDPVRAKIPASAMALLDLCAFQPEGQSGCEGANPLLDLPGINPGAGLLMAGITNDDAALIAEGVAWYDQDVLKRYANVGAGPIFVYGISDWSGNQLTLASTLFVQWLTERSGNATLAEIWRRAPGAAYNLLSAMESGLHAAHALASDSIDDPVAEAAAAEEALWGLRSFHLPKHPHPVDHRIRDDFLMSPWPSLPWKLDWLEPGKRRQGIVSHGMLEHSIDAFRWNDGLFGFSSGGNGERLKPGVDYMILYWLARAGGVIDAQD